MSYSELILNTAEVNIKTVNIVNHVLMFVSMDDECGYVAEARR